MFYHSYSHILLCVFILFLFMCFQVFFHSISPIRSSLSYFLSSEHDFILHHVTFPPFFPPLCVKECWRCCMLNTPQITPPPNPAVTLILFRASSCHSLILLQFCIEARSGYFVWFCSTQRPGQQDLPGVFGRGVRMPLRRSDLRELQSFLQKSCRRWVYTN